MDEYDNDGSGDAAAFGNDSAYGAPGAFGNDGGYSAAGRLVNDGGYGAAGTFGTDSDCAAPGGFGDASGYGTSPGYGAAGGTRDFLSQSAAYSGSAGYRAYGGAPYGGPSSSSRTSSLLGMDALDLNAGDPWARSNAYEDTVGSGAEDGGNGSEYPTHPPLRLPSRSASGTLGLRAARQGARGGGGLARAPSRSLVPTGRCGRGPLMPRHRDAAGGSAGGSRGRGARRRGPAAAASDDNEAAMEDDAPPQVPVQL